MQGCKKQGLEVSQSDFLCEQKKIFRRGIPKKYVVKSKIELEHLTCSICKQVIWKAVACSQQNCFANFCQSCILNNDFQSSLDQSDEPEQPLKNMTHNSCPKCNKLFQKTSIPLINSLLSEIYFKCPYSSSGCCEVIAYDSYLKHILQCSYRKIICEGCSKPFQQREIDQHKKNCQFIVVECQKCLSKLTQSEFKTEHTPTYCLENQLLLKTKQVESLEMSVQHLKSRLISYELVIDKIIKGETIPLHIEFFSSFPFNFQFTNNEVKIIKSSWNQQKLKYDFLHFYLTSSIKTQSPVGFQWKISINVLKGNLLIGICSSLSTNSVDFVINRFGQIKKKQSNQNKYKLIRKSALSFSQGDIISFKYLALRKVLQIQNETKRVESRLEVKEITEIGQHLYSFYSLDTINDSIKFL